jgi:2-keto-3-deoxy-L-rhamnonate aldolase RhmA
MAQKMRRQQTVLGLGLGLPANPFTPRYAQQAGLDWAFLDLEHSLMSASEIGMMANYLSSVGVTPLVRLDKSAIAESSRYLDSGVQGIIMPHVDSADEAAQLVSFCKYAPVGRRSWGGASPQLGFPAKPTPQLIEEGTRETLAIAMVESRAALDRLEEIAATPGLDGLLVGAVDLSIELGVPAEIGSNTVRDAVVQVAEACRAAGIFFGMAGVPSPETVEAIPGLRPDFLLVGMDHRMLGANIVSRADAWAPLARGDRPRAK